MLRIAYKITRTIIIWWFNNILQGFNNKFNIVNSYHLLFDQEYFNRSLLISKPKL